MTVPSSALTQIDGRGSRTSLWIAILIVTGIAGRLGWLIFVNRELGVSGAEAHNVALAFARTSSIANVFGRGSALTAHVNPIQPIIAGTLYKLLGLQAPAAEIILMALALACAFIGAMVFYDAFGRLGLGRNARLTALALFCLLPINLKLETIMFRTWEGAIAVLLLALGLRELIILDGQEQVGWKDTARYALVAAIGLFINPAVGVALYAGAIAFIARNMNLRQSLIVTSLGTAILVAVLAPWTIRNELAFGRFIPLRSNFGLELALANHADLAKGPSDSAVFMKKMQELHPLNSPIAFDNMQRMGGEQAYADALGRKAKNWMFNHPTLTFKLILKHIIQFYFPPIWQFELWNSNSRATIIKMIVVGAISGFGLLGGLASTLWWRGPWIYTAILVMAPALPYMVVQPTLRYHYLVSTLLIFLAVSFVASLTQKFLIASNRWRAV